MHLETEANSANTSPSSPTCQRYRDLSKEPVAKARPSGENSAQNTWWISKSLEVPEVSTEAIGTRIHKDPQGSKTSFCCLLSTNPSPRVSKGPLPRDQSATLWARKGHFFCSHAEPQRSGINWKGQAWDDLKQMQPEMSISAPQQTMGTIPQKIPSSLRTVPPNHSDFQHRAPHMDKLLLKCWDLGHQAEATELPASSHRKSQTKIGHWMKSGESCPLEIGILDSSML